MFNRWFLQSCATGRMLPPVGTGAIVPGLARSLDYLGVNYYTEDTVRFDPKSPMTLFTKPVANPGRGVSSFGWAIDPSAMRRALVFLWTRFRLPLLVTENGVADVNDELRPQFLIDHLNSVLDAVDDGVDIRGYLHWTAWDNFEWAEGYTKRFGMWAVDPDTQQRIAKPSAALYSQIARSWQVPASLPSSLVA